MLSKIKYINIKIITLFRAGDDMKLLIVEKLADLDFFTVVERPSSEFYI